MRYEHVANPSDQTTVGKIIPEERVPSKVTSGWVTGVIFLAPARLFTKVDFRRLDCAQKSSQTLAVWLCERINLRVRGSYWPIELATEENTLFELPPINRIVPTTNTRITANITAYSAMSWP
jgi:hypothetical protein